MLVLLVGLGVVFYYDSQKNKREREEMRRKYARWKALGIA